MNIKTLITLLPILGAGLVPVNATAGATATATVTANIVPAVTVTMPDSVMMAQATNSVLPEHKESINLSTVAVDDAAKFNIKSSGKFTYSMTVSSRVNISNKAGNKASINNFRLPLSNGYVTSNKQHELHMAGALDKGNESNSGLYMGQVYLTANFN